MNKPNARRVSTSLKFLKIRLKRVLTLVAAMLLASTWLTSCAIPITYHDATTYKNLTDLKAEVMLLVESFDTKPFASNEAAIADITLKFRKAYEYEKGKGSRTAKPWNSLR